MITMLRRVFGERSVSKVAGVYGGQGDAEYAAAHLAGVAGLAPAQLRVLGPKDARRSQRELLARSIEPETRGIWSELLRAHAVSAAIGAVVGALCFAGLLFAGRPTVAGNPLLAFMAITGSASTLGLLAGGLLALRPDHALLIDDLRSALQARRWAVVVHPSSVQQFDAARHALKSSGARVLSTRRPGAVIRAERDLRPRAE